MSAWNDTPIDDLVAESQETARLFASVTSPPQWLIDLDDDDVADLVRMLWILQQRNGAPLHFTEREIVDAPLIGHIERVVSVRTEPGDYGVTLRIKVRGEDA